ncbi:ankyrin repeat domain-containing protein [Candidatus Mesenet endosymbiont of Phosphuga atrata]|uniref:ankyrin repeat domain-containing protein n=1 Tax=Candidatus Mesenet endosymbiont of Phosphuga atrata TaxID=3066221 RepID=UPI0030D5450B
MLSKEALINALQAGNPDKVKKILEGDKFIKALMRIPFIGRLIRGVRWFLFVRPKINFQDEIGRTALMLAVMECHIDVVRGLIKAGANMNLQNKYDETALIISVNQNDTEITIELIKAGAEIDIKDRDGGTPLMVIRRL